MLAANHKTDAGQMPLHLISARHYMGHASTVISIRLKTLAFANWKHASLNKVLYEL